MPIVRLNDSAAETDKAIFKIAVLAGLGIVAFFSFGLLLKLFFINKDFNFLLVAVFSATVFLIVFPLQSLFIKNFWNLTLAVFLECLGLLVGFYDKILIPEIWLSALFVFLVLIWAGSASRKELENNLKISFWKINRAVLAKAIAVIFLFSSLAYTGINKGEFFLSEGNFRSLVEPADFIVEKFYPSFDFSSSISDLALNMAKEKTFQVSKFELLPKAEKEKFIQESAKEIEKTILNLLDISAPNSNLTVSQAIYQTAVEKFKVLPPLAAALILFLILESLALPLRLIITFIGYIIYEVLLATEFAVVMLEGASKEIIILK